MPATDRKIPIVSVSQVNRVISLILGEDSRLAELSVRGEISVITRNQSSGHIYFTLKDNTSQLKAIMFRGLADNLEFTPKVGDRVICTGSITVYEPGGYYSLKCADIRLDGEGDGAKALEQLKRRLQAEGLFSQKRPLPKIPKCIAVVTSPTGAAVKDIVRVISRRFPLTRLILIPALVQGEGSDSSVAAGIIAAQQTDADLIIFGRGGGSPEDLKYFNSEYLARVVYQSRIPTISAVGHEIDVSICDFVADLRAATPSAAAELAVPDMTELISSLNNRMSGIHDIAERRLANAEKLLYAKADMISALSPANKVKSLEQRTDELFSRITRDMHSRLDNAEKKLISTAQIISALNPLGVLARGYSVVSNENGILTSSGQVSVGDRIAIKLSNGEILAEVNEIIS